MLRLIHTADWHLGQSFHGFDRDFEHRQFLDWLLLTLAQRRADSLLIAGDIFDSVNPSATAQRLFYDFLARAHRQSPNLQIVIIAGNHDAAARLEAPAGVFQSLNITVVGTLERDRNEQIDYQKFLVRLRGEGGEVEAIALAVPFLRPADVPVVIGARDAYLEGIAELYRLATEAGRAMRDREHPGARLLALGHCHMQEAIESRESERRIVIGGAEALGTHLFLPDLEYVALGHLHQAQALDGGRIQYSGSPVPLSFSEKDYRHQVIELTLPSSGPISWAALPIPKTACLLRVPANRAAPIAEVLELLAAIEFKHLPLEEHPFLEIRVLDDGPDPTRRRRLESALEGKPVRLASIKLESATRTPETADPRPGPSLEDLSSLDPEEIMCAAHLERFGCSAAPDLIAALREILAAEMQNAR